MCVCAFIQQNKATFIFPFLFIGSNGAVTLVPNNSLGNNGGKQRQQLWVYFSLSSADGDGSPARFPVSVFMSHIVHINACARDIDGDETTTEETEGCSFVFFVEIYSF